MYEWRSNFVRNIAFKRKIESYRGILQVLVNMYGSKPNGLWGRVFEDTFLQFFTMPAAVLGEIACSVVLSPLVSTAPMVGRHMLQANQSQLTGVKRQYFFNGQEDNALTANKADKGRTVDSLRPKLPRN